MKVLVATLFIMLTSISTYAQLQNVGIGTTTPDGSAVLDITASDKGVLLPRIDSISRVNISSPANGLIVYDNTTNSFWFYQNTSWQEISSSSSVFTLENGVVKYVHEDDFLFGGNQLPQNGTLTTDKLMFYDQTSGAFRFGELSNSNVWNTDSLGTNSFAIGTNTKATGVNSFAQGNVSQATGLNSVAIGHNTKATGDNALALGASSTASGQSSVSFSGGYAIGNNSVAFSSATANGFHSRAIGNGSHANGNRSVALSFASYANGDYSTAIGYRTWANSYLSTTLGANNDYMAWNDTMWVPTDPILEVGNGESTSNRSTAFTILKNGTVSFMNYTFPNIDGTANQVMQTDGSGNLTWTSTSGGSDNLGNHTATQDLDMGSQKITDLANPTLASDGANKSYVDGAVAPLIIDIQSNETDIINNETSIDNNTNNITDNTNDITTNSTNINNNAANIFNNTLAINTHTSDDMDLSTSNELQTLSIVGQNLTLSSGNTVTLPASTGVFENNSGVVRNTGSNDDHFVFGFDELPQNGVNVTESLFLFDENKGAFRSGRLTNSANWASDSLGFYSTAFGLNSLASGLGSTASGKDTEARGNYSIAMGNSSKAPGLNAIAIGQGNEALGFSSIAMGTGSEASGWSVAIGHINKAVGEFSLSLGRETKAQAYNSTAMGRYNVGGGNDSVWIATDPLFEIGNGTNLSNKNNALTILKDGTVSFENYTFPNADGTTDQVIKTDGSGNLSWTNQPNAVFENNAGVVRNTGAFTDDFIFGYSELPPNGTNLLENIIFFDNNLAAFRVGRLATSAAWATDSLGYASFASGVNNLAIGNQSVSFGTINEVRGDNAIAVGFSSEANGNESSAFGRNCNAIADYAFAAGENSDAYGDYAIAMGDNAEANKNAVALGENTRARYGTTAIGRNNVGSGSASSWVATDALFEIGNGTGISNRSNAVTIYKNGVAEFSDSLHTDGNLNVGTGLGARIYLGNTMMQSGGPSILRMDANIRPFDDDSYDLGSSGKRWKEVWATNGVIQTSDRRLKKNIKALGYGLSEVLDMQPVSYHWKKDVASDKKHVGLIAQELLEVVPEVVNEEGEFLGVKYAELVPVLIQAIKDQQKIINDQNEKITALTVQNKSTSVTLQEIMNRLSHLEHSSPKIVANDK